MFAAQIYPISFKSACQLWHYTVLFKWLNTLLSLNFLKTFKLQKDSDGIQKSLAKTNSFFCVLNGFLYILLKKMLFYPFSKVGHHCWPGFYLLLETGFCSYLPSLQAADHNTIFIGKEIGFGHFCDLDNVLVKRNALLNVFYALQHILFCFHT